MPTVTDWQQLLADLATGLWRVRRRVHAGLGGADPSELRRLRRDLDALADRLTEAGVEITDHTGEPYEPGKSLRVLAFQPTAAVQRETISETLKPTIYHQGQWLQMGEVIVSTPQPESAP
jgi:hypothetical protein